MSNQLWQPKAVALHTAFKAPDKDYNWYIHGGEALLEEEMKAAHYALIRDRKGDAPRIILMVKADRIALLVGTMRTERRDYVNGTIYDTLYLEFDAKDRHDVLSSTATLLAAYDQDKNHQEYQQYEKFFLDYAEALAEKGEKAHIPTLPPIDLPMYTDIPTDNCDFRYSKAAVFSTPESRSKCARYLKCLSKSEKLSMPVKVVSTGRIGKDDLQKYAKTLSKGTLIVLTLLDSIKHEEDLRSPTKKGLKGLFGGILAVLIVGFFLFLQDRTPPQLASLTLRASNLMENLMENPGKPIPRFGPDGALRLTFTDNKAMSSETPPRLALEAGAQTLSFPQPCTPTDDRGQTWECPAAVAAADPNQPETVALTIAEVTDRAGNPMNPVTVELTLESAAITAQVVSPIKLVQRDSTPIARIMIHAEAKYGVAAVAVNGVQAEREAGQANLWQAELLAAALAQSSQPASITVTDTYGNTIETGL